MVTVSIGARGGGVETGDGGDGADGGEGGDGGCVGGDGGCVGGAATSGQLTVIALRSRPFLIIFS